MLRLENISVRGTSGNGKEAEILDRVDLNIDAGKMYALTGPNGGGKTSIAKVIMGIYRPKTGRVLFGGRDITETSITERARMGIGYAFQNPPRFKGLTTGDLLRLAAGTSESGRVDRFLRSVGLCPKDYLDREADASLSGGEMKRLEIAMLLARNPRLMIYDEPEAGVDLWTFEELLNLIKRRREVDQDTATVVITHNEKFLEAADEIILVANGRVEERGTPREIWPMIEGELACKWRVTCGGEPDEPECYR